MAPFFDYIDNTIVARVVMTGVFYYGYLQHTTSFLMTLNRFTAVFFPFNHNAVGSSNFSRFVLKMWNRLVLPVLLVTFFYPMIFQYEHLLYPTSFYQDNEWMSYAYKTETVSKIITYFILRLFRNKNKILYLFILY